MSDVLALTPEELDAIAERDAREAEEKWKAICICGHPVYKHMKAGTEYSMCRLQRANQFCECTGGDRTILFVDTAHVKITTFTSGYRGSHQPSALDQTVNKTHTDHMRWVDTTCDSCKKDFDWFMLTTFALDHHGYPMGKGLIGYDSLTLDTGRYVRLCSDCEQLYKSA